MTARALHKRRSPQMNEEKMKTILESTKTIAVVGLSDNKARASHQVAAYLIGQGYDVIPVNPRIETVLNRKSYAALEDIPVKVDMVDIFRDPVHASAIVQSAIGIGARHIWMQEGVVHEDAAARAAEAGLSVVMDKCIMKIHSALMGN